MPRLENAAVSSSEIEAQEGKIRRMESTLGATLSEVSLADTEGHRVRLGSLWADSPAIIVFLRHYG